MTTTKSMPVRLRAASARGWSTAEGSRLCSAAATPGALANDWAAMTDSRRPCFRASLAAWSTMPTTAATTSRTNDDDLEEVHLTGRTAQVHPGSATLARASDRRMTFRAQRASGECLHTPLIAPLWASRRGSNPSRGCRVAAAEGVGAGRNELSGSRASRADARRRGRREWAAGRPGCGGDVLRGEPCVLVPGRPRGDCVPEGAGRLAVGGIVCATGQGPGACLRAGHGVPAVACSPGADAAVTRLPATYAARSGSPGRPQRTATAAMSSSSLPPL
ncbi:hypothetical protein RKD20_001025 [Streptomyces sp. SLBN-8D4]